MDEELLPPPPPKKNIAPVKTGGDGLLPPPPKKKITNTTSTEPSTSLEPSGASSESKLPSVSGSASPVKNKVGSVTDQEKSAIQDFLSKPQTTAPAELVSPSPEQAAHLIQQGQPPVDPANNILDNTHGQPGGLPEDMAQANEAVVANQNKINQEVKNELVGAFGKYNLKDEGSIQRYFNGYKNKGYNDVEIDNAKKDFFSSIGAALPVPPETSYAEGAVKSFDEGLAGIWRTLDNATILIDKALGTEGRSGTFENLATGLEQHAAKMKDVPEGVTGDIVKGVAGSIPFLYQVALTPELGIPKISSAMAANAFVNTLQETTKEKKDINLSDLVPAAGEAAGEGIKGGILHGLGYTSGVVGDMVKAVTESNAAGGITAAALNSLGFGGLEAAEEYAKTGSVDLSKVASAVGQGIVFSSGELKKAFTDAAKTKAVDNFFSADQKTINEVLKMNVDPVALREQSMKLGEAAEKTPEANQKNELLLAKKAIDKIIDINAMAKDVLKDPQAYIKDIKNNPDIPIEQKAPLIDHINKMANENDAKIQEGKPLSEQINKKKEELSALEEDGTLDPNIKAAKMAPIENEIKELSTKLQTIYDPKLKAELEEKAAKEAEKKSKSETPSEKKVEPEKTKTDETKKTEEAKVLEDTGDTTTESPAIASAPTARQFAIDMVEHDLVDVRKPIARKKGVWQKKVTVEGERMELDMKNEEKIRAIKQIKAGQYDKAAAKNLLSKLEEIYNSEDKRIPFLKGSGGSLNKFSVPLEEHLKLIEERKAEKEMVNQINSSEPDKAAAIRIPHDVAKNIERYGIDTLEEAEALKHFLLSEQEVTDIKDYLNERTQRTPEKSPSQSEDTTSQGTGMEEKQTSYNSSQREVAKARTPKQLSGKKLSELSDQELKDLGFSSIHEALNSTKKRVEGADENAATAEAMPVEYVKAASKHRQEEAKVLGEEARVKVAEGIDQKIKALEKSVFGTATKEAMDFKPKEGAKQNLVIPGATEFGKIQDKVFANRMSKFGEGLAKQAEKMSVSDNKKARAVADIIRAIFPTSALTKGQIVRAEGFHGDINKATGDAAKINELLKDIVNNDKISLSKIDRVIDPEFYKELSKKEFIDKLTNDIGQDAYDQLSGKELDDLYTTYNEQFKKDGPVTYDDLTPAEKTVHDLVKQINDLTHDVSFATGGISHETYLENKDKYAGRLYDIFELPSDVQKSLDEQYNNATDKIFKQRKEVDDWKQLHKIEDPVYAAATRLRQVMINKAVYDYAGDIVKTKPEFVSDIEKPGFTKLADKGYGELSGKYVTQNVAEDFKGFFYQNETLNKFYDLLKRYDRWAPRQFYKKLFTVYNPGVHVGNIMGDNIFGFLSGIDPITLTSNLRFAKNEISEYGDTYRYLIKKGLLKSDLTRGDIVKSLDELYNAEQEAAVSKNPFKVLLEKTKKIPGKAQNIYGGVDDLYKVSAFKSLVDGGYSAEKAVEIVAEGFQNYKRVGKLYDFTSKIPLVGQPFGKFAGDLARILKNAATKRPLSLIAFGATLHAISSFASQQSGETDKERELRENRPGAAKIPLPKILGGDISLDWLLKDKVLNVARFVSPLFVYGNVDESDDKLEAVKKMLPISIETVDRTNNPNGPTAVTIAKNINDPLFSWLQVFLDSDFRGKPILDPNATSYSPSTATPEERIFNAMRFLGRQYIPYGALGDDLISAALGKEGYYNKRTVPQVLSRFMGVKLEDFPKDKYEQIRVNKIKAIQFQFKDNAEKLHRVRTLVKQGKINTSQANERIAPIMEDQARLLKEVKN